VSRGSGVSGFFRFFIVGSAIMLFSQIIQAQPVVIGHPSDTAVCNGGFAHFYVLAVNTVTFQWQENDGVGWYNLDETFIYANGFTTPVLSIIDANLGLDGYLYRCIVYDGQNNMAISNHATLGVNEPPVITTHPVDKTVCKNDIAMFLVSALNADSYQWQESIGQGWIDLTDNAFYSGTQSPVLSIFTTTGMNGFRYRCKILNGNCPNISNFSRLFVNPTPTIQNVTGGGSFCAGGEGVVIGLSGSEAGISYQLFRDGNPTGIVITGSGSDFEFGRFTQAGIYAVKAINGSTGCAIFMLNTAAVVVHPLPLQQQIFGGGSYCLGADPPEIFLSSSETNVNYELFRNGISTGMTMSGSGFSLTFGQITETGFYTIRATKIVTGCSIQLNGNVQILQNEIPVVFAGNNQTIQEGSSAFLQAQSSGGSNNYAYFWTPSAYVEQPNQAATSTIPLYQTRLFSVVSTDLTTNCVSRPDSVVITVSGGILEANIIMSESVICEGTPVTLLANASGGQGNYTFSWTSSPPGFFSNNVQVIVSPLSTTNYHLLVSDGAQSVLKSATITVNNLPQLFEVTGGGNFCAGTNGKQVGLSGSEEDVIYSLYRNSQLITMKDGTGLPFSFGLFVEEGQYTVTGKEAESQCFVSMTGTVSIEIQQIPLAHAGPHQMIVAGASATLTGTASGGSGMYDFSWKPASFLINPNSANAATVPLSETRLFYLTVEDQISGCKSDSAETVVFVSGGSSISLSVSASSYNVCPEEQVQLAVLASGGSGNYTYQWFSNPSGFNATLFNPMVNPELTTNYKVLVTDGFSTISDSVIIQVRPKPYQYELSGGGSYCSGGQGREIYLSGSQAAAYYNLWKNGMESGIVRSGSGNQISFGYQSDEGVYQVKAFSLTSLCGADMIGNQVVQIDARPIVEAGPDQTIVLGEIAQLSATVQSGSGNYSHFWLPANQVSSPYTLSTSTNPLNQTTAFNFKTIDNLSTCQSNTDEVVIFVTGSNLVVQASSNQTDVCLGSPVQLNGYASGGSGNYTFYWTSVPEGFYSSIQNPTVFPSISTNYVLTVSDGQSTISDTVFVQLSPVPLIYQVTGGGNICQTGNKLPIGLSSSQQGVLYALLLNEAEVGAIQGSGSQMQFGLFDAVGTYKVLAKKSGDGCNIFMSGEAVITNGGTVIADAGPDKFVNTSGQVILEGSVIAQNSNFTFSWSPAQFLQNPGSLQPTTKPLEATTLFRLKAIPTGSGCAASEDFVTVFVSGNTITLNLIAEESSICPGEEVGLFALPTGGAGSFSYSWSSNPPGFESNVFNPIVNPVVSTIYKVFVSDGTTTISDSLSIAVEQAPLAFEVVGGGSYCPNSNEATITLSGSQTEVIYTLWRNNYPTLLQQMGTGAPITFSNITQGGTYSILARNVDTQCDMEMIGSADVEFLQPPLLLSSPDQIISHGSSATLTAIATGGSGIFEFHWMPAEFVLQPNDAITQTVSLFQSTAFLVYAVDQQTSCITNTDSTIIAVSGGDLYVEIMAQDAQKCFGDTIHLTSLPGGGSGSYVYEWRDENGVVLGSTSSISLLAVQSQYYYLNLTDGTQAISDSIFIMVHDIPIAFNVTGGGDICLPSEGVPVGLSGSETGAIYTLFINETEAIKSMTGQGNALFFGNYLFPGNYTVKAIYPDFGCEATMTGSVNVNLFSAPIVDAGDVQTIHSGASTQLNGTVSGGSGSFNIEWQPADWLINPNILQPFTKPISESTLFTLVATDTQSGCAGSDQTSVFVTGNTMTLQLMVDKTTICSGEEIRLFALPSGGSGSYSYAWSSDPIGFESTLFNPLACPQVSTKFTVTVSDGEVSLIESVFIEVSPAPQIFNVQGGGMYCAGSTGLSVGLNDSESGTIYQLWRNNVYSGLELQGTGNEILFTNLTLEGIYTIIAKKQNSSCSAFMNGSVAIQINTPPVVLAAPDQIIQQGESTSLSAVVANGSGNYSYHWNPAYLILHPDSLISQTLPLEQSTVFLFYATDQSTGCVSNIDEMLVLVSGSALNLIIIASSEQVCSGSEIQLTALPGGGSGNYSYSWKDESGSVLGINPTLNVEVAISQFFYLLLSDGIQSITDSIFIEVGNLPLSYEINGGGVLCLPSSGLPIGLNNSETGVIYTLYYNYNQALMSVVGQGESFDFGYFNTSGVYTVKATNPVFGCSVLMNGSAIVQGFSPPIVDAGVNQTIPFDGSVQLNATFSGGSGAYLYDWQPATLLLNPTASQPITKPLQSSAIFTLTVSDINTGCNASDETIVFVSGSLLSVDIINTSSAVCPGEALVLTALPSGGTGNYTWLWTSDSFTSNSTNTSITVYPGQTTKYVVKVSDGLSIVSDSVLISTFPIPQAFDVNGGGTWCPGGEAPEIILSGSQFNVSYSLFRNGIPTGIVTNGTGNSVGFGAMIGNGSYTVLGTNLPGCKQLMTGAVQVQQVAPQQVFTLFGGGEFCSGDYKSGMYLSGSQTNTIYNLIRNNEIVVASYMGNGLPVSIASTGISGSYTIEAFAAGSNCSTMMEGAAQFLFFPKPQAQILGNTTLCLGEPTTLVASGGETYHWLTDPPFFNNTLEILPNATTSYIVNVTNSFGCFDADSIIVEVNPLPQFNLHDDLVQQMVFVVDADPLLHYFFYSGSELLQSGTSANYFYGGIALMSDSINVEAVNENGCSLRKSVFISRAESRINAFSPNGDSYNDGFMKGSFMRIYNRWGLEIFSGKEGWDGRYQGEMSAPGTYFYLHEIRDINGNLIRTEKGSVTLIIE